MAEYPRALYNDVCCPECDWEGHWEDTIHRYDLDYCPECEKEVVWTMATVENFVGLFIDGIASWRDSLREYYSSINL